MKRGAKENYARGSNGNPASTYVVESEQKDVIIRNLKGDCDTYRKSEAELSRLNDEYIVLQHRYKAFADQINAEEKDLRMKHECALRTITQLKNEIDALQMELKDKKLEIGDLQSDAGCLKNVFDEKTIELEACRNDYKDAKADENELMREKDNLIQSSNKVKQLINEIRKEASLLQSDTDAVEKRYNELERYQNQLLEQEKALKNKIISFENENNAMDAELNEQSNRLNNLESIIKATQSQLNNIYDTATSLQTQHEKSKNDVLMLQKALQAENTKNNGLHKACKGAQNSLKIRTGQVEQGVEQTKLLREEVDGLDKINNKLEEDLLACRNHLENLGLINGKLIQNMETFNEEDSHVRAIISRQNRLTGAKARVAEVTEHNQILQETSRMYEDSKCSRRTFR